MSKVFQVLRDGTCTLCSLSVREFVVCPTMLIRCRCRVPAAERWRRTTEGGQVCRLQGARLERCASIWAASLHLRGRARGGEGAADSAAGDEVRSFKALIASGKRSHFPNHIRAPVIYFLPPRTRSPLSHSLTPSLSLQCRGRLALRLPVSAFVQSWPRLRGGELCKCQTKVNCDLQGAKGSRWVTRVAA